MQQELRLYMILQSMLRANIINHQTNTKDQLTIKKIIEIFLNFFDFMNY